MPGDLPEPMTPADCDLREFAYMPLDVSRLRDSAAAALPSPEAFRACVLAWCASWHQVPAASLPDDDAALSVLLGYGRTTTAWRKVRRDGGLHGWVKCSDGRLYHPVVAEKANEAWAKKSSYKDRARKGATARWTREEAEPDASLEDAGAMLKASPSLAPSTAGRMLGDAKGEGEGEGERKEVAAGASATVTPLPVRPPPPLQRDAMARAVSPPSPAVGDPPDAWLHLADRTADGQPKRETEFPQGREGDERFRTRPEDVGRPLVAGYYLDGAAEQVCEAARINAVGWRGDWRPLIAWLRDGIELPHIVATVGRVASRPGYVPPGSLRYFDSAVRGQQQGARA